MGFRRLRDEAERLFGCGEAWDVDKADGQDCD
jgi:hypothetical protein